MHLFANAARRWPAVPACEMLFCWVECDVKSLKPSEECFAVVCRKELCAKMDIKQMPVSQVPLVLGSKPLWFLWCFEVVRKVLWESDVLFLVLMLLLAYKIPVHVGTV